MKTSDIAYIITCKGRKITTTKDLDPKNTIIIATPENGIGSDKGVVEALNNVLKDAKSKGYTKFWIIDDDLFNYSRIEELQSIHKEYKSGPATINNVSFRIKLDLNEIEVPDNVCYASIGLAGFSKFQKSFYVEKGIPLAFKFYDLELLGQNFQYEVPPSKEERWYEDIDLAFRLKKEGKKTCKINKFGYSSVPWHQDTNSILMEEGAKTRLMWMYNTYKRWGDNLKIGVKKGQLKTFQMLPKEIQWPVTYTYDISSFDNFVADITDKFITNPNSSKKCKDEIEEE